jgi:hypothetical protein
VQGTWAQGGDILGISERNLYRKLKEFESSSPPASAIG